MNTLAATPQPWKPLDADTMKLLRDGDPDGRYSSQSELAMSLAVRFRNHGHSLDDYRQAMTDSANRASDWYWELRRGRAAGGGKPRKSARGEAKANAELERCWHKAGHLPPPRALDVSDIHERCERARAFAERALTGRTRSTRLKALEAVLARALRHVSFQVLASDRSIALEAGLHRNTARRCLHDLCDAGVLSLLDSNLDVRVVEVNACSELVPGLPHLGGVRRPGTTARQQHRPGAAA